MNRDNHNKSCLRNYLLILVLLACARGEAWGAADRQGFHEMRTLATMATANVLLYYNINGIPYEAERREAVTNDLSRLHELAAQVGDVALVERVTRLGEAVIELDALPQSTANVRSVSPAYTRWLPGLVEAHFGLDQWLSERYVATPAEDLTQGAVQGLSHDVGRMLLSYQMASFPNFGGDLWILNDQALITLDAAIEQRFTSLIETNSRLAPALKSSLRDYRFVRQRLLDPSGHWAPNAVALYLVKTMQALDAQGRGQHLSGYTPE